jgi:photosystem II stability/assembly factor-like uncharacterized protein
LLLDIGIKQLNITKLQSVIIGFAYSTYCKGFVDEERGFLLGTRQSVLEANDGGRSWTPREIPAAVDEAINYRFNSISFYGEGRAFE